MVGRGGWLRKLGRKVALFFFGLLLALAALAVVLKLLFPLPDHAGPPDDLPVPTVESPLADTVAGIATHHPGETGLIPLDNGIDAFAMRLAMVRNAQRTIDAQYYIWEGDLSGRMLLEEIIAAADRGVRVRLLVDDNPTSGLDPMWAAVSTHPNIAVRLFNPLVIRAFRPLNYLFDFPRLNRRMHNKSLTVDSAATVVGGRNVGDVYFGVAEEGLFIDLDMLAIGTVVPEVEAQFETYWASESAFPVEVIVNAADGEAIEAFRKPHFEDGDLADMYEEALEQALQAIGLDNPDEALVWAPVELMYDSPAKALGNLPEEELLAARIAPLLAGAQERIDLVSGYFVPSDFGTQLLAERARAGVATRVVTNSIQVTDVSIVHAGYVPSREPLLDAGVALFEARPRNEPPTFRSHDIGALRISGGGESLHAKTFGIDNRELFVGSFNFDPRSALLNCEMGFLIHSPEMARGLTGQLDEHLPDAAYRLSLDEAGNPVWTSREDGAESVETEEPGTTGLSRAWVWLLSKLPIAWML